MRIDKLTRSTLHYPHRAFSLTRAIGFSGSFWNSPDSVGGKCANSPCCASTMTAVPEPCYPGSRGRCAIYPDSKACGVRVDTLFLSSTSGLVFVGVGETHRHSMHISCPASDFSIHKNVWDEELIDTLHRVQQATGTLLIHGARSVIYRAGQKTEPNKTCAWVNAVVNRRNKNVAAVALANKNARIVWALLAHDRQYEAGYHCNAPKTSKGTFESG
jgi:hypothetical protein